MSKKPFVMQVLPREHRPSAAARYAVGLWSLCVLVSASACIGEAAGALPHSEATDAGNSSAEAPAHAFEASESDSSRGFRPRSGSGGPAAHERSHDASKTGSSSAVMVGKNEDGGGANNGADGSVQTDASSVSVADAGVASGAEADAGAANASKGAVADAGATDAAAAGPSDAAMPAGHGNHADACGAHEADPRDATMSAELERWERNGNVDLLLPRAVRDWLNERSMLNAHGAWHGLRQCRNQNNPRQPSICRDFPDLVAVHQECSDAEDGYNFLTMHRHMLQDLRASFPQHRQLFAGFARFPYDASGVPAVWRSRFGNGWSAQIIATARILEDIEAEAYRFPNEGALGQFIQCGGLSALVAPEAIHAVMHQKWNVEGSPVAMDDFYLNLGNPMFWQLHGWLDQIWERYRVAAGLPNDDPQLRQALEVQCREMHALAQSFPQ